MHINGEHEDEELLVEAPEPEEGEKQKVEAAEGEPAPSRPDGEDDGDLIFEVEGDEPDNDTPAIRQIREELRRTQKERDELKRGAAPKAIDVGKKPSLWEDCDGDEERYERELIAYNRRVDDAEKQKTEAQQREQREIQQFEERRVTYKAQAQTLGIKDFQKAEDTVVAAIPVIMQNAIIRYADSPAKVVAALGNNPTALNRMAAITDPGEFIKELVKLEGKVQMTRRKPDVIPDAQSIQRGSASIAPSDSYEKRLEKLEKEAERTGDRSKIIALKREQKQKAAAK